jgi:hypothetical protein
MRPPDTVAIQERPAPQVRETTPTVKIDLERCKVKYIVPSLLRLLAYRKIFSNERCPLESQSGILLRLDDGRAAVTYDRTVGTTHGSLSRYVNFMNRLTEGWAILGIARFSTGLPVTRASNGDNFLVAVRNDGINSVSIDLPNVVPGNLATNHIPRNASLKEHKLAASACLSRR